MGIIIIGVYTLFYYLTLHMLACLLCFRLQLRSDQQVKEVPQIVERVNSKTINVSTQVKV